MKTTIKAVLILTALFAVSGFAAEGSYGLERGSVGAFVGGGVWISQGTHPAIGGGMDFGLHKYVGLYGEAGEGLAYGARMGAFMTNGGVMVTGNNRSRIIPFARVGMGYERTTAFGYGVHLNRALVSYAGGFDAYITKHFGMETQIRGGTTLGYYGSSGATIGFGVFYRSK
jgi:hypothetical protein